MTNTGMGRNKWTRPAIWAAVFGWLNLFGLSWVVVLRLIPVDVLTWLIWSLFFVFAMGGTAMGSAEEQGRKGAKEPGSRGA